MVFVVPAARYGLMTKKCLAFLHHDSKENLNALSAVCVLNFSKSAAADSHNTES